RDPELRGREQARLEAEGLRQRGLVRVDADEDLGGELERGDDGGVDLDRRLQGSRQSEVQERPRAQAVPRPDGEVRLRRRERRVQRLRDGGRLYVRRRAQARWQEPDAGRADERGPA